MNVNIKEVMRLWVYMVATIIALVACGLLYVRYGEQVVTVFLAALYVVGVACSYFSGTSPEVTSSIAQRWLISGSLFWFVLLAVTAIAATVCLVWANHFPATSADTDTIDIP